MASIKEIAQGRSDVYLVKPSDLSIKEGWNGREPDHPENVAHVDALAQSIAAKMPDGTIQGVKEPLAVYVEGDKIFIENGHMRHAAALLAIEKYDAPADLTVPVRTTPKDASEADRIMSQIIRNSGRPLLPLEMAGVFQRLQSLGLSDSEIAERAGLSRVYIAQLIELSKMPKGVTGPVREGTVSATLAIQTMKRFDGDGKKVAGALKDAIAFSKSQGKTKATSKDVKKAAAQKGTELPAEKKKDRVSKDKAKDKDTRTERKSTFTVMSEVRTTLETASYTHITETEVPGVSIFLPISAFRDLTNLLDLEAYKKTVELADTSDLV